MTLPADRVRMHVCWGNDEVPHHKTVPLATILPTVLQAKPQCLLFETANPRHGHAWASIRDMRALIPQHKVLIPGVLGTATNFIEHPQLMTQRLRASSTSWASNVSSPTATAVSAPLPGFARWTKTSPTPNWWPCAKGPTWSADELEAPALESLPGAVGCHDLRVE